MRVGETAKFLVSVNWISPVGKGDFDPRAKIEGPTSEQKIKFVETTTTQDLAANKLSFTGEIVAPNEPGQWRIVFDFAPFDGDYSAVLTTFTH